MKDNRDFEDRMVHILLDEKLGNKEPRDIRNAVMQRIDSSNTQTKAFPVWFKAVAAIFVILIAGVLMFKMGEKPVELASYWKIEPTGNADYEVLSPTSIRLNSGELFVYSIKTEKQCSLQIETQNGVATAEGTSFFIGNHNIESNNGKGGEKTVKPKSLTRILVMSGIVSMSAGNQTLKAEKNEVLIAEGGKPQKLVVQANNDLGIRLYKQLAKENNGKNLFFSPYSIMNALCMTAEGARGQTALEMGKVLGYPKEFLRAGKDAQHIPWEISKIHSGISSTNRLFNSDTESDEMVELKAEIATLQKQFDSLETEVRKLEKEDKRTEGHNVNKERIKCGKRIDSLKAKLKTYKLSVANNLWLEKTYKFNPDYTKTIKDSYDSALQNVDFAGNPEAVRNTINEKVEAETRGKIKNILPKGSVLPSTKLILTNAIYFKGDWVSAFDKSNTRNRPFTLIDGKTVGVPLMRSFEMKTAKYAAFNGDGTFFDTPDINDRNMRRMPGKDGFAMLEMPYCGEDLSMIVMLPMDKEGLAHLENKITSENISKWVSKLENRDVTVEIPRFKAETSYVNMKSTLMKMGMETAFSNRADFSGIAASEKRELFIAGVVHKAFVDINEKGTEAAAATSSPLAEESVPFVPTFSADHPFVFAIRDKRAGNILFMGRIMNPAE